ncbi:Sjoegren syndrome/scleroderma autoantigen 1, partial [Biomphalaria glabrata]
LSESVPCLKLSSHTKMDLDEWQPPTEAEMKIIKARQERSNKISQIMSTYLLKGYKMLGSVCSECDTIILQDRQGQNYCVACSELDSEEDKDNPVLNPAAASSLAKELSSCGAKSKESAPVTTPLSSVIPSLSGGDTTGLRLTDSLSDSCLTPMAAPQPSAMREIKIENLEFEHPSGGVSSLCASDWPHANIAHSGHYSHPSGTLTRNMDILVEKVEWACQALRDTRDLDYSIRLCQMIKAAGEAINALRKVDM